VDHEAVPQLHLSGSQSARLDWSDKGFWLPGDAVPVDDLVGTSIFDGPFTWPLLTLDAAATEANIHTVAQYFAGRGVSHAPHAKTTMAPTLFQAQMRAGAWGLTAATANQALVYRRCGVPAILLASPVLDPRPLAWLAQELDTDASMRLLCYVDSAETVAALATTVGDRPLEVLVELGFPGGRTGCRTSEQALAIAQAAAASPRLRLAGVSGYEGLLPDEPSVRRFLRGLHELAGQVADAGLVRPGPVILSAGGSHWFDAVVTELTGDLPGGQPVQVIARAGSYLTHDDGWYAGNHPALRDTQAGPLRSALRLWAQVLSAPEPGLAIAGFGRRDAPYDAGLPVPLAIRDQAGTVRPVTGTVTGLNDQHSYLTVAGLRPGELVCFGVSHPCGAFDRWRAIPLIEPDGCVVDVIRTYF
jgi:D-serine deaminase-like pyridoxal phosphate-dependent protein